MVGTVYHRNWIEEEITQSYADHPDTPEGYVGRMVFCKLRHAVMEPDDCDTCPYFAGYMQGYGHECAWPDVLDTGNINGDEVDVPWEDRDKELLRVSEMIDDGLLKKY